MTKFVKENFIFDGMYLHYMVGEDKKFVARFKWNRGQRSYKKFLIENFEVEEYFTALDGGDAPLRILMSKGYISDNSRKILKSKGLPQTKESWDKFVRSVSYAA